MYPYIDGRGLRCGYDNSTDLSLREDGPFVVIVCNVHDKSGNTICSVNQLSTIAKRDFENMNLTKEKKKQIADQICNQLSTLKYKLKYNESTEEFYL